MTAELIALHPIIAVTLAFLIGGFLGHTIGADMERNRSIDLKHVAENMRRDFERNIAEQQEQNRGR